VRVKNPTLTHNFVGDQPGSWRVWAIDDKERPGEISAWSMFTFGPDNQLIPQPPPNTAPRTQLPPEEQPPVPQGKLRDLPVFDPKTGEACSWPPAPGQATGVTLPKAVYSREPQYAEGARAERVNGAVMLAVDLGEDGLVKRACVLSASRDDLGRQALDTVRTWRFQPAKKDGSPIPYSTRIEVTFRIAR
jgi:protein TonB